MKSLVGKISGIMIFLVVIMASFIILKQAVAQNEPQINETITEQVKVSDNVENITTAINQTASEIGEALGKIFNISASEGIIVSNGVSIGNTSTPSTFSINAGAEPNPVYANGLTTLWCDYRENGELVLNANVEFRSNKEELTASYNPASQKYEYSYNSSELGSKIISCFAGNNSASFELKTLNKEKINVSGLEQGRAEIGKPVKWIKRVPKTKNLNALDIAPKKAFNVSNLGEETESDGSRDYLIGYSTEAPQAHEESISKFKKRITVSSDTDYSNILTYTNITDSPQSAIRLYWIVNGSKVDVTHDPSINLTFIDTDNNGLIDRLEWITPHTSNQTFEVDIIVLNPYTFVRNNENWTVAFNTTGQADLIISSTNANWIEFLTDNPFTNDEMRFLDINCGSNSLKDSLEVIDENGNYYNYSQLTLFDSVRVKKLLIRNYSCDETGYLTNNMLKAGYAILQFNFGNQTAYAYDAQVNSWPESISCSVSSGSCNSPSSTCNEGISECYDNIVCSASSCGTRNNAQLSEGSCSKSGCTCNPHVCSGTANCGTKTCTYTCNNGWGNDDGNNANGCENRFPTWIVDVNSNNSNPHTGDGINFSSRWTDEAGNGLSNFTFSWNASGTNCDTWINETGAFQTNNWTNVTKTIPAACNAKTISIKFYANDTANRENVTSTLTISISDSIAPQYYNNSTNSTLAGTPVKHSLNWTDNFGLSGYIFQFCNGTWTGSTCTGGWANDTWNNIGFSGTSSWSNVTRTANSTAGATIAWCVYANDTSNNWNGTSCSSPFTYNTTSYPSIVNQQSFTNWTWGGYNVSANATDTSLTNIQNCTIYHRRQYDNIFWYINNKSGVYDSSNGNCSTNISVSDQNQIVWSNNTSVVVNEHAIVANETEGVIYMVDNNSVVYKINATNGTIINKSSTVNFNFARGLSQDASFLYFFTTNATNYTLVKVNKTDLNVTLNATIGFGDGGDYGATTNDANFVYIGDSYSYDVLKKVNKTNFSDVKWTCGFGDCGFSGGDWIYDLDNNASSDWLYSCGKGVVKINKTDKSWNNWRGSCNTGGCCRSVVLDTYSGNLWVGNGDGNVTLINDTDASTIKTQNYSTVSIRDIAVDNYFVYSFDDQGVIRKINKTQFKIDPSTAIVWNFTISTESWHSGDIDTNYIYTSDYNNGEVLKLFKNSTQGNYTERERVYSKIRFTNIFGLYNETTVDSNVIPYDQQPPTYSFNNDSADPTTRQANTPSQITVNVSWSDNKALSIAVFSHNLTGSWSTDTCDFNGATQGWCNKTISTALSDQGKTFCWNQSANDTTGNLNNTMPLDNLHCIILQGPPYFIWNFTNPSSGTIYSLGTTYIFNITVCDSNGQTDINLTTFEWNGINTTFDPKTDTSHCSSHNSTCWNCTFTKTDLSANTTGYTYKWYVNDSAAQWGSLIGNYVINKAALNISIYGSSVTYPTFVNITINKSNTYSGDSDVNYTLWRNTSSIPVNYSITNGTTPSGEYVRLSGGDYLYVFNTTVGPFQNYTANTTGVNIIVTVNKGTSNATTFIEESPTNKTVTYPTSVTLKGNSSTTITPPSFDLTIYNVTQSSPAVNIQNLSNNPATLALTLGNGTYNVVYNSTGNANWTSISNSTLYLMVNQGSRTTSITFDKISPQFYGTAINASCAASAGSSDGTLKLYRNISGIYTNVNASENNQLVTLPAGAWGYICNITDGANYSSTTNSSTFTINKMATSIKLYINGTEWTSDQAKEYPNATDINATINVTVLVATLMKNGTVISNPEDVLNPLNVYNYTGNYSSTENYSVSSVTRILTIQDTIKPQSSNNQTNDTSASKPVNFSLGWTDNAALNGYIFSTNNSGAWTNSSWIAFSGNQNTSWNVSFLNNTVGSLVQWMFYANDISNNWNTSSTFNLTTNGTAGCNIIINNQTIPYTVSQNNTVYCLNQNIGWNGVDGIDFSNPVQNTTLNCLNYNINSNQTTNTNGIYLIGASTKNNTIKNCNVTNFYYGVYIYNGPSNNTLYNNTANSNYWEGFQLHSSSNNTLSNNTANSNSYGIDLWGSSNNTLSNNTANSNDFYGIYIESTSNNNNITSCSVSNTSYGIWLISANNNTLINNTVNNSIYGFGLSTSLNNIITGGSASNNSFDYYLTLAVATNNFTSTNFTAARKIYFNEVNSWFNYNNETTGNIWLKTNVSASSIITRTLVNWNNTLMQWNDSNSTSGITARYNLTGLLSNKYYDIYNGSSIVSTNQTDSSGNLPSFTIFLNGQTQIKVQLDLTPPQWSSNQTSPTTPASYLSGQNYQFNITWTDNGNVSDVTLNFNGTNYTLGSGGVSKDGNVYYKNIVDLAVGSYNYSWYANDSNGNSNNTNNLTYVISKANPTINLTTNCTWVGTTYEVVCNQTGYVITGDVSTENLTRDGVQKATGTPASEIIRLGFGSYVYNYSYYASQNYSFMNVTNTLIINPKTITLYLALNGTQNNVTYTYPQPTNATGWKDSTIGNEGTVYLYRNGSSKGTPGQTVTEEVLLGNGTYNYTVSLTATNYTASPLTRYAFINKGVPSLLLDNNISWIGTYPANSNTTGSNCPSIGASGVSCTLYRNDTGSLGSGSPKSDLVLLAAGAYNYSYNTSGGTNWTSYQNSSILTISKGNVAPIIKNITFYSENLGESENYTLAVNYVPTDDSQNYTDNDINFWYFDGSGTATTFTNTTLILNLGTPTFPFSKNLTLNDTNNNKTVYNVTLNLSKSWYYQNETGTINRTYQLIAYNATWTNNAPAGYPINISWNFSSPSNSRYAPVNLSAQSGTSILNPSGSQINNKTVWYGDWINETNESWRQDPTRSTTANSTVYVTHDIWLNNSWNFTINNLNIEEYLTNRTDVASWNCNKILILNVPASTNTTFNQSINCSYSNIILGYQTQWAQNVSAQSNTSMQYINTTANLTSSDTVNYTNVSYTHPNLCPNNFTCSGFSQTMNYTVNTSGNITYYPGYGNILIATNTTWSQDSTRGSTSTTQYINYTVNMTRNDTSPSINFTNVYYPNASVCPNNFSALGSPVPSNYTVNIAGNLSIYNCSGNVINVSNINWAQNATNTSQTIDSQNINETIRLLRNDTGSSNSIVFNNISYTVPSVNWCKSYWNCYPNGTQNVTSWIVNSTGNTTIFWAYLNGITNAPSGWQQNLTFQSSVSNVSLNQSLALQNVENFALNNLAYSNSDWWSCSSDSTWNCSVAVNCPNGFSCSGMSGLVSLAGSGNSGDTQTLWASAYGDVVNESQTNWSQNISATSNLSIQYINSTVNLTRTDGSNLTLANVSYSIMQCPSNSSSNSPVNYTIPTTGNLTYLACSGDNITESWQNWQQDWTKITTANSTAYSTRNMTIQNNATNPYLNFTNLQTNWRNLNRSSPWSCSGLDTININYNSWNNTTMIMNCTANNIIQIKSAYGNWQQDTTKTTLANGTAFVEGDSNYTNIDNNVSYTNVQVNATSYNSTLDRTSWTCSFNNSRNSSLNFAVLGNNSTSNKPVQCNKSNVIQPLNTSGWVQDNSSATSAGGYAYIKGRSYFNNTDNITYNNVVANSSSYFNSTLNRSVNWNCSWNSSLSENLNFGITQVNQTSGYSVLCNQNNTITKVNQPWTSDNSTEQNITKQWIIKNVNGTNTDPNITYININYTISEFPNCKSNYACNVTTENITINANADWGRWINASNATTVINTSWANRYLAPDFYQNISINDTGDVTFYNLTAWSLNFNDTNVTAGTEFIRYLSGTQWVYITPISNDSNCDTLNPNYTPNQTINGTFYVCKKDTNSNGKIDYFKFKIPHTYNTSVQILQIGSSDITSPTYNSNGTNTTIPNYGKAVLIYTNWSDDTDLSKAWLWTNETGGNGINYTSNYGSPFQFTSNPQWSNFTWQNTSISPKTVINWKIYANDSSNNVNVTQGSFRIWGLANVTELDVQNLFFDSGVWKLNRSVSAVACRMMDANFSTSLENYPVNFYKNDNLQTTNLTNSSGYAVWNYNSTADLGPYVLKCNITDNSTLFYNKSANQVNSTIYVWRKLYIDLTDSPNEIYRISSLSPYTSTIQAHFYDDNSTNVSFQQVCFYRQYASQSLTTLSCSSTDSNGIKTYNYDASTFSLNDNNPSWPPQNYTIYSNHSSLSYSYPVDNATYLIIRGQLYPSITSPSNEDKYYKNQIIDLNSATKDEWGSDVTQLNSTNWTLVETNELLNQSENGQWNISINHNLGNFTVNYSTSKDWFYSNWDSKNISIFGYSAVNETGSNTVYRGSVSNYTGTVYDYQNSSAIANYTCVWWSNSTNIQNTTTNSSGNCVGSWNAICPAAAGPYFINVSLENNSSLFYDVSANNLASIVVNLTGNLSTIIGYPSTNSILHRGDNVSVNSTVRDDCNNNFSDSNMTAKWYLEDLNASGINSTILIPIGHSIGPKTLITNVTKNYYTLGANSTNIYIYGWSSITNITPAQENVPKGTLVVVTCHIKDANTTENLENYPVNFYKNDNLQTTNLTNSSGYAVWNWDSTGDNAGSNYTLKCNITDNSTLFYNKSTPYEQSTTVGLSSGLYIDNITKGCDTLDCDTVYRNNSYSGYHDSIYSKLVTVHVIEAALGSSNASNVSFYNSTNYLDSCLTNESGYCNITFDPSDNTIPQNYTLYMNATKSGYSPSSTNQTWIIVKGAIPYDNVNILYPPVSPVLKLHRGDSTWFNSTIKDENYQYIIDAVADWRNSTPSGYLIASGAGNSSGVIPINHPLGNSIAIYELIFKNYYDRPSLDSSAPINIWGWSNVSILQPSSGNINRGTNVNVLCRVTDANTSESLSSYTIRFWNDSTNSYSSNSNSTGYSNYTWNTAHVSVGPHSLNCTVPQNSTKYYDGASNVSSVNITLVGNLTASLASVPQTPIYRNASCIGGCSPSTSDIVAHVVDEYSNYVSGANVSLYQNETLLGYCPSLTDSNGNCTYTYNPSDILTPSNYSIKFNATKQYYYSSNTIETYIAVKGKLYPTITYAPTKSYRNDTIQLNSTTRDENGIVITPDTGNWYLSGAGIPGSGENTTWQIPITQSVGNTFTFQYSPTKTWYDSNMASQATEIWTKANVTLYSPLAATYNRSSNITFYANVTDYFNSSAVPNYNCSWWLDGSNINSSLTNSQGTCSWTWYTGCSNYAGLHAVNSTISSNSTIFYDPNVNNSYTNTTLLGFLRVRIDFPSNNSVWHKTNQPWLNSTVNGECSESITNPTVNWNLNSTQIATGVNNSTTVSQNQALGNYFINASVFNASYNSAYNTTNIQVWGWSNVSWIYPTTGNYSYGSNLNLTCRVTDANNSTSISGYAVSFWKNESYVGSNVTAGGNATYAWNTNPEQLGLFTWKCNITDNSTLFYNSSVKESSASLTLVDGTPPIIANLSIAPNSSFEANYNYTNVTVDVTDNFAVSNVWAKITLPNTTVIIIQMSNISAANYKFNYTPVIGGLHNVTVYANDTSNNTANVSSNFTAIGNTTGIILSYPLSISAAGINRTSNYTFEINFTLNNTGNGTMRFVNVSFAYDPPTTTGFYANNTTAIDSCLNLTAGQSCTKDISFNITTLASADSTSKIVINATWQNPDYTVGIYNNNTSVYVSVNTILFKNETQIVNEVNHSQNKNVGNLTIYPWGNTILTGVNLSASQGNLSESWITYDTSMPFTITPKTSSKTVKVNVSIPLGQDPGLYWTNITANATGSFVSGYNCSPTSNCWSSLWLNITVPEDKNWNITPSEQNLTSPSSQTVNFTINLNDTGNVNRTWSISKAWTQADHPGEEPTVTYPNSILVNKTSSSNISFDVTGSTGGNYTLRITFTNASADPQSKDSYVYINVLDTPPQINNPSVTPSVVDVNHSSISMQASISDNIQISMVWYNITKPDGTTYISYTNVGTTPYSLSQSYMPDQIGDYSVRIYANDSANGINQTDLFNFTSVGSTSLAIISNATNIGVSDITQDTGKSFVLNISVNNTGQGGAYFTNQSYEMPNGWTSSNNYSYNNLTSGSYRHNVSTITIPKGTTSGLYYPNATVSWLNPDNTLPTNKTTITVNVSSNPVLNITQTSLSMTLNHGSSNSTNFTLNSTGNDVAQNININYTCSNCTNLSLTFTPDSISSLNPLSSTNITVNVSAPLGFAPGNYIVTINASGTGTYTTKNLIINVPENKTWGRIPDSFAPISVGLNSTGDFGTINITNYGNLPLTFNINVVNTTENATQYIFANVSTMTVAKQSSGYVKVNYSSPSSQDNSLVVYSVNVSANNATATPSYPLNTTATLNVFRFKITTLSPNQTNPTSLYVGNIIEMHANATIGDSIIGNLGSGENISWTVNFGSTNCPLSGTPTFNSSYNYWTINCAAPSLTDATYYTLNIIGNYTNQSGGISGALASDNKANAIYYIDVTPPTIIPYVDSVPIGSNASVRANITDNLAVSKVMAEVTYPNASKANYTMANITTSTWEYNLTNAVYGDYDVKVYSNDTTNNWNTNTTWFEVYDPVLAWFNGTNLDKDNNPISLSFNLYRPNTTSKLYNFSSNSSGGYSQQVKKRYYDFNVLVFNNTINLTNVSITGNVGNASAAPISLDSIPASQIGSGTRISKAMYIQTVLNYTNAMLTLNYSGTSYTAENYLGVYRCDNWSYSGRSCNSSWSRINSTLSTALKTLTVSTTDLSGAYAAAEFICGDGICETSYGESNAVCPTDCPTANVTSGPSGPGGGGGVTPTTPTEEITVPLSLSTSLIEVRLYPGEYQLSSIGITNNEKNPVDVSLSVDGDIWPYTLFEKDKLTIGSKQTEYAKIRFFTMPTTTPGIYNGNIIIKSGDTTHNISVILRVEYQREKILDVKVEAVTKEVIPGQKLKYQVTLYNLGLTKRVDVFINYTVKSVENDKVVAVDKETMAVETSLSFMRTIDIPETSEQGLYSIEAVAWYINEKNETVPASSVASFSVVKPPWIYSLLLAVFTNWITYIILFVAIPCFYLGWKAYDKWKVARKVRARYIRPLNVSKLPTKGLWLGKIAETNSKAFFDEAKLTTHMIIAGGTGSGKSVAGMIMAEECLKKGVPVIVFDPTAQWTGFVRPCKDKAMLSIYPKFGIKPEEAQGFKGTIFQVRDPFLKVEVEKFIKEGEITVFVLNKLTPDQLDYFVRKTIDYMFTIPWEESRQLKALIVFDEVHRLLPKYTKQMGATLGGGEGYLSIERACREFRKWGLGLVMLSQVLLDFRGAIRAVIATESQMRTKYEGDIERIKTKYGWEYSTAIPKLEVGTGMIQNPEYNDGKPWFVKYRPLLHDTFRLTEEEINKYEDYLKEIEDLQKKIETLKGRNIDTYDMELELKLALDKVKTAQMRMAETYIESVKSRAKMVEERS